LHFGKYNARRGGAGKGGVAGKIRKLPLQDAAQETARRRRWLAKNNAGPHKKVNQGRKLSKLADDDENTLENNVPFSKNVYPIWVIIK